MEKTGPLSHSTDDSEQTQHDGTRVQTEPPRNAFTASVDQRMGDFILQRELGRGGFARVYLAHQVSLDRRVALKLSQQPSRGEGQTLAGLEHDHIVKVYAEFHDEPSGHHGLVLQYVPGTSVADVLALLFKQRDNAPPPAPKQGADILRAIDHLARGDTDFDPAALRDRELLARSGYVVSICRMGARLAEALAFAHSRGILHCDVKPGNILLNRYGRPMLVDFNVAVPIRAQDSADPAPMGGTTLYMSPEQLAAFAHLPGGDIRNVDHRTDLYSLGLVLLEMLLGQLPFQRGAGEKSQTEVLREWKAQIPERWLPRDIPIPTVLWRVLRRCLDPDPALRHASGTELAHALNHAADLLQDRAGLPRESRLARFAGRRPITLLSVLVLLPHVVATVVNIVYNRTQIPLSPSQEVVFLQLVMFYNACIYPLCLLLAWVAIKPLVRTLNHPATLATLPNAELDFLRRRTLSLGFWTIGLALLGWLSGGVVFPLVIHLRVGASATMFAHFLLSFTLSGLIALVYSYFGAQYVILRGLYYRFAHADQSSSEIRAEQNQTLRWIGFFQVLAALVPLTGAILLLVLAGELSVAFRLLVVGLITAGMFGLGVTVYVAQSLRAIVATAQAARLHGSRHP